MKKAIKMYEIYVPWEAEKSGALQLRLLDLAKAAGGYTMQEATGGWVMSDGAMCQEPVHIIKASVFTWAEATQVRALLEQWVVWLLEEGGQEAVLVNLGEGLSLFTEDDLAKVAA